MAELIRTILWQEMEEPGSQIAQLWRAGNSWQISGEVVKSDAGMPLLADYQIDIDAQWHTRRAQITVRRGNGLRSTLAVQVDADQRWTFARDPAAAGDAAEDSSAFTGLIDIDFSLTPATNTLPIRRLALAIGESAEVTAIWIDSADLTVMLLPQRYLRLDERRYRYESSDGAFVAELEVDELGLAANYEGLWRRIAQADPVK